MSTAGELTLMLQKLTCEQRMNPNLVFWQQVADAMPNPRPAMDHRPPSYISDDGVAYIVEAQPRSTAYEEHRVHPSERGRIAWPSST